jgi:hypothetical protein
MVQAAYDIIKAHSGELRVETPPAEQAGKVDEGNPDKFVKDEGSDFIGEQPSN